MSPERCGTCHANVEKRAIEEALVNMCKDCQTTLDHCGVMLMASSWAYCDGSDEEITCAEGVWLVEATDEIPDPYYDDEADDNDDGDLDGEDYDYSGTRNRVITAAINVLKAHPDANIVIPPYQEGNE